MTLGANCPKFSCSRHDQTSHRTMSSLSEAVGGGAATAAMLQTFHYQDIIPYYFCFSLTSLSVRLGLLPLVVHGAHISAKLANVAPEIQFIVSHFGEDMKRSKKLKVRKAYGHPPPPFSFNILPTYMITAWIQAARSHYLVLFPDGSQTDYAPL